MAYILVVDDDPMVLELVKDLLTIQGHTLETANNGAEAVTKVKLVKYDLLIIDRNMPIMTGVEAIAAIRADPGMKGQKILMFSSAQTAATDAFRAGADGYLLKPIQMNEFLGTINKTLAMPK